MGSRRVVKIDILGKPAEVVVTEVTPGRWAWVVYVQGAAPLSSRSPVATGQVAMAAAMQVVRRLSGDLPGVSLTQSGAFRREQGLGLSA